MQGHGLFNWWGFSPPIDFFSYMDGSGVNEEVVQVAVVGAGDPRHLLLTLARSSACGRRLRIYVVEAQLEVYARLLLLFGTALQLGLGLRERSGLLLDLWANLYLRPASRTFLELTARRLSMAVTDPGQYCKLVGLVSAAQLKYRERDAIDAVCRSWYTLTPAQYDPALAWDERLRKLLGTRYDYRQAEADWAWHMRLTFRVQQLRLDFAQADTPKGEGAGIQGDGYVGLSDAWGQEFLSWRSSGRAFTVVTDNTSTLANTSLASVAVVGEGETRHRQVGYWGDMLSGPFPALAFASHLSQVNSTQHDRSILSGSELALRQLEFLLDQLWSNYLQVEEEEDQNVKIEVRSEQDVEQKEGCQQEEEGCQEEEEGCQQEEERCQQEKERCQQEEEIGHQEEEGGQEEEDRCQEEEEIGQQEEEGCQQEEERCQQEEEIGQQEEEGCQQEEERCQQEEEIGQQEEEGSQEEEERCQQEEERGQQEEERGQQEEEGCQQEEEIGQQEEEGSQEEEERGQQEEERGQQEEERGQEEEERGQQEEEGGQEEEERGQEEEERGQQEEERGQQEEERCQQEEEISQQEEEGGQEEEERGQEEEERGQQEEERGQHEEERCQQEEEISPQEEEGGQEEEERGQEEEEGKREDIPDMLCKTVTENQAKNNTPGQQVRGTLPETVATPAIVEGISEKTKATVDFQAHALRTTINTDKNIVVNQELMGGIKPITKKEKQGLQIHEKDSSSRWEDNVTVGAAKPSGQGSNGDATTITPKADGGTGVHARCSSTAECLTEKPRKKSSVEGGRPYFDYLQLEGVEVVLISPSRLSDLSSLPEVEGGVDVVYLSAATAHLLSPSLFSSHLRPHSTLILESVQMFPELTEDQMKEYESRVTKSAEEAGWVRGGPEPLCHLTFHR